MNTKEKGNRGEDIAADYLSKNGVRLLRRNYRCRTGEIDIIGMDGDNLVFYEVKSWNSLRSDALEQGIGHGKQKKIITVSKVYIEMEAKLDYSFIRYDVIFISDKGGIFEHYKNAFTGMG